MLQVVGQLLDFAIKACKAYIQTSEGQAEFKQVTDAIEKLRQ